MTTRVSLRYSLPLGFLGVSVAIMAVAFALRSVEIDRRNEALMVERVAGWNGLVVPDLEARLARRVPNPAGPVFLRLRTVPHLKVAGVCDEAGRILNATRPALRDQTVAAVLPGFVPVLARARAAQAAQDEFSAARDLLRSVFPLKLNRPDGTQDIAWFSVESDVAAQKAPALAAQNRGTAATFALILLCCAGLWLYVDRALTRRITALVHTTREISEGRLETRARLTGRDEIAQLGEAFNRMASELQARDASLRASESRLRTIITAEPECVKVVDGHGRLLEMNPAGLAMLDATSLAEVQARPLGEWVTPEFRAAFVELHRGVMRGENRRLEFEVIGARGTRRWLDTTAAPLRDEHGTVVALLGVTRDITARRQLEAQLRQAQKMEAIGQLAGGIAHDFNNILTVVIVQTELGGAHPGLPQAVADAFREIRRAGDRATSLTNQLLAFGRRQVIQMRHLDLNAIVTTDTRMLQRLVGEDVQLELTLHPRPLPIHADEGMLGQVLLNLAINARDAMPHGGRLIVETFERTGATGAEAGRYACLRVQDTGGGIAPDVLPHIFEPFFTTKAVGKGTGLGLATVFGIAQQHRGWVTVESPPGAGAAFCVFLPLVDPPAGPAPTAPTAPARRGSETILLVEDESIVRMTFQLLLEQQGYHVLEAEHGPQALELWQQHRATIALLLTDIVMPGGMTGRDLARRLQAESAALKVIFMSGYSAEIAGRGLELQAHQNFLQKPFTSVELFAAVRQALDAR